MVLSQKSVVSDICSIKNTVYKLVTYWISSLQLLKDNTVCLGCNAVEYRTENIFALFLHFSMAATSSFRICAVAGQLHSRKTV